MRRKITIKAKQKKARRLVSRVYWSRVGFVLASATAATLSLLYAEERERGLALQEAAWASDERMLLVQSAAADAIQFTRERRQQIEAQEQDLTDLQSALDVRLREAEDLERELSLPWLQSDARERDLDAREAEVREREDAAQARELELDLLRLGLETREANLAKEEARRSLDPDREFELGVEAYERGEYEAAEAHFRNVLRGGPSDEQALRHRDQAGYRFWVRALTRGGPYSDAFKKILRQAEDAAEKQKKKREPRGF